MLKVLNITKPNPIDDIDNILFTFTKGKYGVFNCQNIVTFDIETTTSYIVDGEAVQFDYIKYDNDPEYRKMIDNAIPISTMYCWQMAVSSADGNIYVFFGREWYDFHMALRRLTREAKRQAVFGPVAKDRTEETLIANAINNNEMRMRIYSHSMQFEFQHLRNLYEDKFLPDKKQRVFARSSRKPMKVDFILDRKIRIILLDTFVLTQKSLKNWCKDEQLPVMKCPPIDYSKIRHPLTKMDQTEIQYCLNDVISMVYGIDKYKTKYGVLENIPLTQTACVKRKVCTNVYQEDKKWCESQYEIMRSYTFDFFTKLTILYQGGWTHGNKNLVGKCVRPDDDKAIAAFDFASSYPGCATTMYAPISKFELCDPSEFDTLKLEDAERPKYIWFAKLKISNKDSVVMSKKVNTYWSASKCLDIEGTPKVDNGRLQECVSFTCICSDLDYKILEQCYTFDTVEVLELYKAEAGLISKALILQILEYFGYKTALKGTDNLSKYNEAKEFINSIYGVTVYKIINDIIEFTYSIDDKEEGWNKIPLTEENGPEILAQALEELKVEQCFGAYQIGIRIATLARYRLWEAILHFDERMLYADTDSIKILNFTKEDEDWINNYNKKILDLEESVANELGFDKSLYTPKTSTGKTKYLGIWEREEDIAALRYWGAKRYAYETRDEELYEKYGIKLHTLHTTIAGLPKEAGTNKLSKIEEFTNHTVWNTSESMKNTAVYNDNQPNVILVDDDGVEYEATDKYGIAIVPTTFDMSLSPEFEAFLYLMRYGKLPEEDDLNNDIPSLFR